jgi:large subunit ribosomal protein L31e
MNSCCFSLDCWTLFLPEVFISTFSFSLELLSSDGLEAWVFNCIYSWFIFLVCSTFKKMAPKAVKEIRKFAQKAMGTSDVRVDVKLNKHIWSRGVRNVPTRVRVRIARKRNDDEDAKEELYSYVSVAEIPPEGLRNLGTKIVEEED